MGLETILATVGLVGDEDDVAAVREERILLRSSSGENFWIVVKITPPEATWRSVFRALPVLGLDRGLMEQVLAGGEGVEELVVQVVPVVEDYQRGILHGGMDDDLAGIEGHGEALATALSMPDHTCLAVSTERGSLYGAIHSFVHGVVLVVGGHLLDHLIAIGLEDYEVFYEI